MTWNTVRMLMKMGVRVPEGAWRKFVFYAALCHILLLGLYPGVVVAQILSGTFGSREVLAAIGLCLVVLPLCLAEFGLSYTSKVVIGGKVLSPRKTAAFWVSVLVGRNPA